MYESYFGFRERPFSLLPDPDYLFLGETHSNAYTMLQYGIVSQAGFTVFTGDIGSGKTTLVRRLLSDIDEEIEVGLISNTNKAFGDLLQWVLLAFSLDHRGKDRVECFREFVDFLIDQYSRGRRTVLIVDEAQNLGPDGLEELRTLSNVNADKDQVLQLILVGQPQLRELLRKPELEQFVQRILAEHHLGPLSASECKRYIRHRVARAGGDPHLFRHRVCLAVHKATGGVPRLINAVCDSALVYAFGAGRKGISEDLLTEVLEDRSASGLAGAGDYSGRESVNAPARPKTNPPREPLAATAGPRGLPGSELGDLLGELKALRADVETLRYEVRRGSASAPEGRRGDSSDVAGGQAPSEQVDRESRSGQGEGELARNVAVFRRSASEDRGE